MPTTSGGLRYPASSDAVNVPGHLQNLADDVDTTKAPKESPALTGTPTAPTAAADTNTTQVATTAYVIGQAGSTTPTTLGTAAVGTSNRYARADHRHAMPSASDVGAVANSLVNLSNATTLQAAAANNTPLVLKGAASQTADLLVAQNSAGTTLFVLDSIGGILSKSALYSQEAATGTTARVIAYGSATFWGTTSAHDVIFQSSNAERLRIEAGGRIRVTAGNVLEVPISTNAQTGNYTLVLGDAGRMVEMGSASAITLTVPADASVAFPVGTKIDILRTGAGEVSIAGATSPNTVTVNSEGAKLRVNAQWQAVTLIKRAANTWVLIGALKA